MAGTKIEARVLCILSATRCAQPRRRGLDWLCSAMAWALTPLTEEQRSIQSVAREFARQELAPFTAEWDRDAYFEPSLIPKLGDLGFFGMMIPEEYDGLALDTLTYLVAPEEIAIVDA